MTWLLGALALPSIAAAVAPPLLDDLDGRHSCLARAGNVDGDGLPDLLVASRESNHRHRSALPPVVWVLSGATGEWIRELRPEVRCARFGSSLAGGFDVDGDGWPDAIVGADDHRLGTDRIPRRGAALVYSGKDGSLLHFLAAPDGAQAFGFAVAGSGDVDGDGRADVAVGAPETEGGGSVYLFSGRSGELLYELCPPATGSTKRFGNSLAFLPDSDGDGREDLLVGAPGNPGVVELHSGASGALLRRIEDDERIGWIVGSAVDVDADGVADVFTSAINSSFRVHSGRVEAILHELTYHGGYLQAEGASGDGVGDLDADGCDDFAIAANETWMGGDDEEGWGNDPGFVEVRSGRTGAILHGVPESYDPAVSTGYDVCGVGDVDGDGRPEVAIENRRAHAVELRSGADFAVIWRQDLRLLRRSGDLPPQPPRVGEFDDRSCALAAVGDLDGDGRGDLIVASRELEPYRGLDPPAVVWAISSRDGSKLHEWRPERPCLLFGCSIASTSDLDRRGRSDVLVGAEDHPFSVFDANGKRATSTGLVFAFSGEDGNRLCCIQAPDQCRRFGYAVAGGADVDGDERQDILVGAPGRESHHDGAAFLFSGADGRLLQEFRGGEDLRLRGTLTGYGHSVAFAPDLDGDGARELLVGIPMGVESGEPGRIELFSGASFERLRTIEERRPIGWAVGSAGDLDGDAIDDLWTTSLGDALAVYSGSGGERLFVAPLGLEARRFEGATAAAFGDLDGDGLPELALGLGLGLARGGRSAASSARILAGSSGAPLRTIDAAGGAADVAAAGDVDGDGLSDLAVLLRDEKAVELRSGAGLELLLRVELSALRKAGR